LCQRTLLLIMLLEMYMLFCSCCVPIKTLKIEKSISDDATDFEAISEKEFEHTEGYDHFVSLHRVSVEG
uniref:Uncharacterized protein n=1 Tax=Salmo trutta TaxID=8032 RepID=A0A673Z0G4_SALTR